MELFEYIKGKKIRVRRCNEKPSRRVAVISHGRFLPVQAFFSETVNVSVPPGISVNWYVRHGETITSHSVLGLYERLQRGESPVPIKNYLERNTVKNYALRADPALGRSCTPRPGGHCDIMLPVDIVTTQDILESIREGQLPYSEVHFLSCRASRLTHTSV